WLRAMAPVRRASTPYRFLDASIRSAQGRGHRNVRRADMSGIAPVEARVGLDRHLPYFHQRNCNSTRYFRRVRDDFPAHDARYPSGLLQSIIDHSPVPDALTVSQHVR